MKENHHGEKRYNQLDNGRAKDEQLSAFIAADDAEAKRTVLALSRSLGFDPIDAGPLRNARLIEPVACLLMQLAGVLRMGLDIGFRLVH